MSDPKNPNDPANPIAQALIFLSSTDWMVIRELDNGITMPDDIRTARQSARILIAPNGVSSQVKVKKK